MVNCCALGCTNRGGEKSGLTFHRIPKNPDLRQRWIEAIGRENWNPGPNTFVCSEHFKPEDFNRTYFSGFTVLRQGVVPTFFEETPRNADNLIEVSVVSAPIVDAMTSSGVAFGHSKDAKDPLECDGKESDGKRSEWSDKDLEFLREKEIDQHARFSSVEGKGNESNYRDLCRICMGPSGYSKEIFVELGANSLLFEVINDLLELEIYPGDGLPAHICSLCHRRVLAFQRFKKMTHEGQVALLSIKRKVNEQGRVKVRCMGNLCRLCVNESGSFKNIFKGRGQDVDLFDIINKLCHLCMSVDDSYPEFICQSCYANVLEFYKFKCSSRDGTMAFLGMREDSRQVVVKEEFGEDDRRSEDSPVADGYDGHSSTQHPSEGDGTAMRESQFQMKEEPPDENHDNEGRGVVVPDVSRANSRGLGDDCVEVSKGLSRSVESRARFQVFLKVVPDIQQEGHQARQKSTGCKRYQTEMIQKAVEKNDRSILKTARHYPQSWGVVKRHVNLSKGQVKKLTDKNPCPGISLSMANEIKVVECITELQQQGFGLTLERVRHLVLSAQSNGEDSGNESPSSDNANQHSVDWNYCRDFCAKYRLDIHLPMGLPKSQNCDRACIALQRFYNVIREIYDQTGKCVNASQVWSCDETGLCWFASPERVVSKVGKNYLYSTELSDNPEMQINTVLPCVNAAGGLGPILAVFRGLVVVESLTQGCALPNMLVGVSPNGFLNSELFSEWFKKFVLDLGEERPVILLLSSHAHHISPEVLELAYASWVILVPLHHHRRGSSMPVNISINQPLGSAWQRSLLTFRDCNPYVSIGRENFLTIFSSAFQDLYCAENVVASFCKCNLYPPHTLALSSTKKKSKPGTSQQCHSTLLPYGSQSNSSNFSPGIGVCNNRYGSSNPLGSQMPLNKSSIPLSLRVKSLPGDVSANSVSAKAGPYSVFEPQTKKTRGGYVTFFCETCKTVSKYDEGWGLWTQCSFCFKRYHKSCQRIGPSNGSLSVFMCKTCAEMEGDDCENIQGNV